MMTFPVQNIIVPTSQLDLKYVSTIGHKKDFCWKENSELTNITVSNEFYGTVKLIIM